MFAVQEASASTVKGFLDSYPIRLGVVPKGSLKEPSGFRDGEITAIHCAVEAKSPEKVHLLLEHGADVLAVNPQGKTPLENAMDYYAHNHQTIRELMTAVGVQRLPSETMIRALHRASRDGNGDTVSWLLSQGVDALAKDESRRGRTALHSAASAIVDASATIAILLDAEPDMINAVDCEGQPPLHCADDPGAVRSLLASGADVFAVDRAGKSTRKPPILQRPSFLKLDL